MASQSIERIRQASPRLLVEERPIGWEVIFYDESGNVRHLRNAHREMEALRVAWFACRHYHYDSQILMRTRSGEKHVDLKQLMQTSYRVKE